MRKAKARGRRKGTSATRTAILAAARGRFARAGYAGASMRAIAADAGVDAALVHHYFGTKQRLFGAATEPPPDPAASVREALEARSPGEALILAFLAAWDAPDAASPLAGFLRSAASDADAQKRLADLLATSLVSPVTSAIARTHAMPKLRATLVAAQLTGLAWTRYVLRTEPIATASPAMLAKTLAGAIDATLGTGSPADARLLRPN